MKAKKVLPDPSCGRWCFHCVAGMTTHPRVYVIVFAAIVPTGPWPAARHHHPVLRFQMHRMRDDLQHEHQSPKRQMCFRQEEETGLLGMYWVHRPYLILVDG
jgi:hypothetical protein